jgi:hypothetical protein
LKIGLFGDSFGVAKQTDEFSSWFSLLSAHYDIINHCECGIGEYKILEQLRNSDLEQFDHIIITHTSATRVHVNHNPIHSESQYHKNCDIILADIENRTDQFSVACQQYFKHIFDLDYAIDVHNMICKEIQSLVNGKSVTHITHFDYSKLFEFPNIINFYEFYLENKGPVMHYNQPGNIHIYQVLLKELCSK